jgi:hypothetical protein
MIQDALGIESDDVVNYCFPKGVASRIVIGAPGTSASGALSGLKMISMTPLFKSILVAVGVAALALLPS